MELVHYGHLFIQLLLIIIIKYLLFILNFLKYHSNDIGKLPIFKSELFQYHLNKLNYHF